MNIPRLKVLDGLDPDIRAALIAQVRDLWTHGSTALEGNTLTLGETKFVIEEGLTVAGKPLKDHQEVVGHARAIELIYGWTEDAVTLDRLFDLHRAVQTAVVTDIYQPNGAWKREPNGTYAVTADGRQIFIEYAMPDEVPRLMATWLTALNRTCAQALSEDEALTAYARLHLGIVHIRPFLGRQWAHGPTPREHATVALRPPAGGDRTEGSQALYRNPGCLPNPGRTAWGQYRSLAQPGA